MAIKRATVVAILGFILSACNNLAYGENNVIKIAGGKHLESPSTLYLIKLYTEIFKRAGYRFDYTSFPNKRSSKVTDNGEVYAGELSRVPNYSRTHPNMIRLDIPHYTVKFIALSAKYPMLELNGWDSLQGKGLNVTYRQGTAIVENKLPTLVPKNHIYPVGTTEQGLKILLKDRADVFIEGSVNVFRFFEQKEFKDSKLYIAGVMEELNIYMFIHNNYGDLVPKLNSAMKDVHSEGLFDIYRKESNFSALQMR